jgi:DNA-binding NarL/FixJ family response regulator
MPGKDGLEVAEELRADLPGLPIILYTGHDDICTRDDRARFATVCVEKRTDLSELKRAIVRVLSSTQGRLIPRIGLPPVAKTLEPHQ